MKPLSTCSRNAAIRFCVRWFNRILFGRKRSALAREVSALLGVPVTAHHMTNTTNFRRADGRGGSFSLWYTSRASAAKVAECLA